jgi:hypothetical protein
MTSVKVISSPEEWDRHWAEAAESRRNADASVTPEAEAAAAVGSYFIRLYPVTGGCLTIYGVIIESRFEEDRALMSAPHMRFMRLTQCYSMVEPEGEPGNVHIAAMTTFITKEQFEQSRADGWPSLYQPS